MTPTHLRDLVEIAEKRGFKPRPTYSCILGGARVLRSDWLDAKNQLQISAPSIGYGCSEASPGISHLGPGIEPLEDGEIGDYLNHLQVTSLPTGLDVAGASICLATIENAKIDFPKNLKVNDLIVKSPSGRNVFTARTDIILNRGGEKFSLESIENFLKLKHGLDTICVALKDDRLGEELGIVISGKTKTTPLSRDEIYASLTLNFGRRFSAKNVQEVEELPMNANSKIDRKKAVTLFRAN